MENNENLRFFMDESSAPYDEHMLTNEDTELIEELLKNIESSDWYNSRFSSVTGAGYFCLETRMDMCYD